MGKNSLIKSTSKKTAEKEAEDPKKKPSAKKKAAAKSAPAKGKKTAAKAASKSAAKPAKKGAAKASSKSKTGAKAKASSQKAPKAAAAAKKTAPAKKKAPPKKKPASPREILFQKFDDWQPESLYTPPPSHDRDRDHTAPPLISTDDPGEASRLKKLLFAKFSPEALKEAAKKEAEKKTAEEKASAEKKAAQEKKSAEEKAQKAAAEKAAPKKTEAPQPAEPPEPEVSVTYPPPEKPAPADPMEKAFKYAAAGFAALLLILVGYSFANTGNYYLESANGGLKIFQGRFAPMGKKLMITLPGLTLNEPVEDVYARGQVYPLIYDYYIGKADALLEAPGLPDYEGIRRYLQEASIYATTGEARNAVHTRLDGIELMTLLYKADVAASKNNVDSLEEALDYLNEASRLEIDASQAALIDERRETVRHRIEQLEAEAEAAAAPTPEPAQPPAE